MELNMPRETEYEVLAQRLVRMTQALIENPDFYKVQAQATRLRFQALVEAGFAEHEALAITAQLGSGAEFKPKA